MKTTIDNNQRIFMLTGDSNISLLCNLKDLEKCFNSFDDKNSIKIQHRWNGRFVRCSKKSIVNMLKAFKLNYKFL